MNADLKSDSENVPLFRRASEECISALLDSDYERADGVIEQLLKTNPRAIDLYAHVLLPTLRVVGDHYSGGSTSVVHEHLTSETALRWMDRVRAMASPKRFPGGKVAVTTADGDYHFIGARAAADFLYFDGWKVDFLGASTPGDDLAAYVEAKEIPMVVIAISVRERVDALKDTIAVLKAIAEPPAVIVGGPGLESADEAITELNADAFAATPLAVVEEARSLSGLMSQSGDLPGLLDALGAKINQLRGAQNISQQQLADAANLDRAYISGVENGKRNISLGALLRIAAALSVSIEELLAGLQFRAKD